jgi:hypothetical protein
MIKYFFLLASVIHSTQCLADSESSYKAEFHKKHFQSCYREMTSGADKVDAKLANRICSCLAERTVSTLPFADLKKYDSNPLAYKDFIAATISKCLI